MNTECMRITNLLEEGGKQENSQKSFTEELMFKIRY
jgi:hypothetical protein